MPFVFIELTVFEIKKRCFFIKTRFYFKPGCMKMRTHGETFYANKGSKLAIVFFYQFTVFKIKFGVQFSNAICTKTRSCTPHLSYENESLLHWLSYYLRRMTAFSVLEVRFFHKDSFFSGSGSRFWSGLEWWPSFCLFYFCFTRQRKSQNQSS